MKEHTYHLRTVWSGNDGTGTKTYRSYRRDHTIGAEGKAEILASSDPNFLGDKTRYNPEDLLVASLSSCHMLWYLHLCSANNIVVVDYRDEASGWMTENKDGSGEFTRVLLRPTVTITAESNPSKALSLHDEVHHFCFIARSVKFPVDADAAVLSENANMQ